MAAGDVYTDVGEALVIDLIDANFSTTWQFQSGIGTTTPAKGDTAMENVTGCPAKAYPSTPAKTQPSASVLQCVGTIAYTGTLAITEFGWFGPTGTPLFQHHVFAAINVVNGDSIEFTVTHTQA